MKPSTYGSTYFFYILLVFVLFGAYLVISPFITSVTLAFLTAVMFQPVYRFFVRLFKRTTWATIATFIVIMCSAILPVIIMMQLTIFQLVQISGDVRGFLSDNQVSLETVVIYANELTNSVPGLEQEFSVEQARKSIEQSVNTAVRIIADQALRTGASTVEVFTQSFVYLFLLFFLLPMHRKIPKMIARLSPLDDELDYMFMRKALAMAQSMIRGTVVISIIQAVAGGIVLAIAGVPYVLFWTVLMIFLGIIPVVGASTVLLPSGFFLIATGNILSGVAVIVITIIGVSNIDNILRPHLVSKEAELHPALILIGVLGGLKAFGLLGVIYGPVIMIVLVTMFEVLEKLNYPTGTEN